MKKEIHPTYHHDAKVICACGWEGKIGSTKEEVRTELCSNCHPFFTGKQKLVDTAGRVDRFRAKMERAQKLREESEKRKGTKKGKTKIIEDSTKKKASAKKAKKEDDK